jgi:hypothetical protein
MYDEDRIDAVLLTLLHLNAFGDGPVTRAWKGFDWDALDRLHDLAPISAPKSKAKWVVLSGAGARRAAEPFEWYVGTRRDEPA